MIVGDTLLLKLNKKIDNIQWRSSNTKVATVDSSGNVKAIGLEMLIL